MQKKEEKIYEKIENVINYGVINYLQIVLVVIWFFS